MVGGDGSVSHAVRGMLRAPRTVPFAIFSEGTGNDFVKSLDATAYNVEALASRVAEGRTRGVDVGMIDDVPFLNAAGFGFDAHVVAQLQRDGSTLGGAAYAVTALRALFDYQGIDARVDDVGTMRKQLMLVFANGRHFGGAFRIAPTASIDDGVLDMVAVAAMPLWKRVPLFARAISGTHISHASVEHRRAREFVVHCAHPPLLQLDGELHQAKNTAVSITTRAGALRVIV